MYCSYEGGELFFVEVFYDEGFKDFGGFFAGDGGEDFGAGGKFGGLFGGHNLRNCITILYRRTRHLGCRWA